MRSCNITTVFDDVFAHVDHERKEVIARMIGKQGGTKVILEKDPEAIDFFQPDHVIELESSNQGPKESQLLNHSGV